MEDDRIMTFKQQALEWARQFEVNCCFDANGYPDPYGKYDFLLAAGVKKEIRLEAGNAFASLQAYYDAHPGWLFGMLGYDLKNELEELQTPQENLTGFADLYFFVPEYLLVIQQGRLQVMLGPEDLPEQISRYTCSGESRPPVPPPEMKPRMDRKAYLEKVAELQRHIARGDVYELNFCQEFYAEHADADPYRIYRNLSALSPTPFAGFFKVYGQYILSASPERFLCKRGNRLISQPIKGTARRGRTRQEDEALRSTLLQDPKERAENVMIVDLVRNDLTRSAAAGTVRVDELFGIYTFPQVHQMISTVSCELADGLHPVQAIRNAFPAGSMTGAPKLKAMELIGEAESSRRGMYSGAFGYMDPSGDFDFNVVIRSILYNSDTGYLSFQVGGAITYAATAASEYEECLLKASAMLKTLKGPD